MPRTIHGKWNGVEEDVTFLAAGDAPPPTHTHPASEISGTAVVNSDVRLTDARRPAYVTGDGGVVTQLTSKSTGVTLNKACGRITTHNAALAAAAEVSFTVTNSTVAATDVVVICIASGAAGGNYFVAVTAVAAGSFRVTLGNASAGSLSEAIVLNFAVVKAVAS